MLRAKDAALVEEVERAFLDLRVALGAGAPAAAAYTRVAALIDRAEDLTGASGRGTFVAAAVIFLREGAEAVLLIAAILAAVARLGGDRRRLRAWVHAGWVSALAAGGLTWLGAGLVVALFSNREAAEGWTSLLAAAILFYCGFWLISQGESRRWMGRLKGAIKPRPAALFAVAFLAVYREAAETVLFLESLVLAGSGRGALVAGGALAGLVALLVVVAVVRRLGQRLPLGVFFGLTGALMYVLAVVFAGKGIHALQIAGVLAPRPLGLPDFPWLGFYGDSFVVAAQAVLVALFLFAMVLTWAWSQRQPRPLVGR